MSPTASATSAVADRVFGALADPTRRDLLRTVIAHGPITVTDLAVDRPMSRQAVTKHLGVLADAGLLRTKRTGRETHYVATQKGLAPASRWLRDTDTAWEKRLERLRRQVAAVRR